MVHLESDFFFPHFNTSAFKRNWDIDVSYGAWADVQMSYMVYTPQQLRRMGAPFVDKRDSLLFVYSKSYAHRIDAFHALARAGFVIDAPGVLEHNIRPKEVSPECSGHSRSGKTRWSESECLLSKYKFYIAWENSVSTSYVTEKLWQGLAAGAVPIYRGAPDIRALLPHPDAAIMWDDYESADELATYV
jgi:hypothetical protein